MILPLVILHDFELPFENSNKNVLSSDLIYFLKYVRFLFFNKQESLIDLFHI